MPPVRSACMAQIISVAPRQSGQSRSSATGNRRVYTNDRSSESKTGRIVCHPGLGIICIALPQALINLLAPATTPNIDRESRSGTPNHTRAVGVWGVLAHNLMVASYVLLVWAALGVPGLVVLGLSAVLAGVIGVFLVYLQHNFEDTYWDRKPDLDFRKATLVGSSSLDLGHWWDIGTGNIAYHDLHHFNPAIPSFRLRQCQRNLPEELKSHEVIRWPEAISSFRLKLWDEEKEKLVPFPAATAGNRVVTAE